MADIDSVAGVVPTGTSRIPPGSGGEVHPRSGPNGGPDGVFWCCRNTKNHDHGNPSVLFADRLPRSCSRTAPHRAAPALPLPLPLPAPAPAPAPALRTPPLLPHPLLPHPALADAPQSHPLLPLPPHPLPAAAAGAAVAPVGAPLPPDGALPGTRYAAAAATWGPKHRGNIKPQLGRYCAGRVTVRKRAGNAAMGNMNCS